MQLRRFLAALVLGSLSVAGNAAPAAPDLLAVSDSGDTAWLLTASALILMMTLPGLGLFYGGLVRARNALSVLLQIGAVACVASVLWVVAGYTLAFGPVTNGVLGNGLNLMLANLGNVRTGLSVPESAFALLHMTFAAIAPALMIGAWAERARFGWVLGFCALWGLVVYAPVAHWVWGGGWLASRFGTLDFAGGIVVHTTAGVSALVVALLLGKRTGWPSSPMRPHAPALTMAGAALLWVGWFGFNGASALAATDDASSAIINTHLAASVAALTWLLVERFAVGKPTSLGWASGAVAGLVTITPAAGYVSPGAAILFGLAGALAVYGAARLVRQRLQVDDSLSVFAVHGVGGITGALLGAFALSPAWGGVGYPGAATMGSQFAAQVIGVLVVALWSAVATAILALLVNLVLPMRVTEDEERDGLDRSSHGERAWELD